MTPPRSCANCHGAPSSQPYSEENSIYRDPNKKYLEFPRPITIDDNSEYDCIARENWPEWLEEGKPELQKLPFWVRSNFEKTLQWRRKWLGEPALPFRFDVGKASLDVDLKVKGFEIPIASIRTGPDASIRSHLEIQDNRLPLFLQSLLEFNQIKVRAGPLNMIEVSPLSFGTDFNGNFHFLAGTNIPDFVLQNFLGKYLAPEDQRYFPHNRCYVAPQLLQECWPYYYSSKDFFLSSLFPKEFRRPPVGDLPINPGLEDLIYRGLQLKNRKQAEFIKQIFHIFDPAVPPPKRGPALDIGLHKILNIDNLKPGTKISLNLEDLRDFFLPALLDIGPSYGRLNVVRTEDGKFHFDFEEFSVNIEEMDYPYPLDGERGAVRLTSAHLSPGPVPSEEAIHQISPGLHFVYDPVLGQLQASTNVDLSTELTVPFLGPLTLEANINFETTFQKVIDRSSLLPRDQFIILPKENSIAISGLQITRPDGSLLLANTDLSLTDNPSKKLDFGRWAPPFAPPTAEFNLSGIFIPAPKEDPKKKGGKPKVEAKSEEKPFYYSGNLGLPTHQDGSYDFGQILKKLDLDSVFWLWKGGDTGYQSKISLKSIPLSQIDPDYYFKFNSGEDVAYHLGLEVNKKPSDSDAAEPILTKGEILFIPPQEGEPSQSYKVQVSGDQFTLGKISLNGIIGNIEVADLMVSEEEIFGSVPVFDIRLNSKGPSEGLFRGPLMVYQVPEKDLHFNWKPPEKRLEISGLDFELAAKDLYILPPKLKKILDPSIRSMGIDGNLRVDFGMNFKGDPSSWNGKGVISLMGDPEGDVYFLDASGRRVGEPLIRNTQWKWVEIRRINTDRGYGLGSFFLVLWLNPSSFEGVPDNSQSHSKDIVQRRTGQRPHEIVVMMPYDNQPVGPVGFKNYIEDYIRKICYQTPDCLEDEMNGHYDGGLP